MSKTHWYLIIGYLVGSFFGIGQLLGLFSQVTGRAGSASASS